MGQMNISQIGLNTAPIETNHVRRHRPNKFNVGDAIFPSVSVDSQTGTIRVFGDEAFTVVPTKRAPGAVYKNVAVQWSPTDYKLTYHGLATRLTHEDGKEAKKFKFDLVAPNLINLDMKMKMSREKDRADLVLNAANYPANNVVALTGATDKFTHPDSDPKAVVRGLVEQIEDQTGEEVTLMTMSKVEYRILQDHPKIIQASQRLGDKEPTITTKHLEAYFDIKKVAVSAARYKDVDSGNFFYFWEGGIFLGAVPDKGESKEFHSFAYTYQHKEYPLVQKRYWDNNTDEWVWKQNDNNQPIIVSNKSGALILGVK